MTNDSEFSLFYAHNLTKIYGTFNSRIANIITFIQILFGSSLALDVTKTFPLLSDYHWTFWTGAIVTATAILSFVYKFDEKALLSNQLYRHYGSIISKYRHNPALDIDHEMLNLPIDEIKIVGAFEDIAYKRTAIQLSRDDYTKLDCYQCFIAYFSGDSFND